MQFADNGLIRKWSREPFEGGVAYVPDVPANAGSPRWAHYVNNAEWKFVPVEPTEEMVVASSPFRKGVGEGANRIWSAMLAAAPSPAPQAPPAPDPQPDAMREVREALSPVHGDAAVIETLVVALEHRMEPKGTGWRNKNVGDLLAERGLAAKVIRTLWGRINRARAALQSEPRQGVE